MGDASWAAAMQLNRFDLNLLVALDALLREKSVTRAAERVYISQPAMSGALQRLREFFDDQLLVRIGRDMELTPRAQSLIQPVREILLLTQSTLELQPTFEPATTSRSFTLVMSDYCLLVFLSFALRRLAIKAPGVQINVEPLDASTLARLESGDVDLCLIPSNARILGQLELGGVMQQSPLFTDQWACVVSADHPSVQEELTLEQYFTLPHAFARFGGSTVTLEQLTLHRLARDVRVAATAPGFVSAIFLLPGTSMVATVQERLARAMAHMVPIRVLKPPLELPLLQEAMVWHERNALDPGHLWLRRFFADVAASLSIG